MKSIHLVGTVAACLGLLLHPALAAEPIKNIVLVHGAFADGSGWKKVSDILSGDGFNVTVVQEPETSLEDDVAATVRAINQSKGPVVLVGHSYGGIVITQAGNIPNVQALVYVAALAPVAGEKLSETSKKFPPPTNNVLKSSDGFLTLNRQTFRHDFAADIPEADAQFMALSQVPISEKALTAIVTEAAWKSKPSFYAVATKDQKISPDFERFMAKRAGSITVEVKGSHAVYISQPRVIADLIERAASETSK